MPDFQAYYYITLFLATLISFIFICNSHKSFHRTKSQLPPTPFRLPIIGHLHLLCPIAHQAFHNLSINHDPLFQLYRGSTPCVVASSPETAKEIVKTHDTVFLDWPHNSIVNYFAYGGKGFIFAPYGPYWKFLKKIVMSELLNGKTLGFFRPMRHDEVSYFVKYLFRMAKDGKCVELEGELMKLTSNVISRMFMGKMVSDTAEIIGKFNFADHIWFCKKMDLQGFGKASKDVHGRFDGLMERIMREHEVGRKQEKGEVKDLLNVLLDISEEVKDLVLIP